MPLISDGLNPRIIKCDTEGCPSQIVEPELGAGFPGWGGLHGILKDNKPPQLCPECKNTVAQLMADGSLLTLRGGK